LTENAKVAGRNWRGVIGVVREWERGKPIMLTEIPTTMPSLTAKFFAGLVMSGLPER